jgi:Cu2+-exporting ATPase
MRFGARSGCAHSTPLPTTNAGTFTSKETDVEAQQEQQEQPPEQLQTVMLDVGGMMCGGCSAAVKNILLQQPGVKAAAVNLITHAAAVTVL